MTCLRFASLKCAGGMLGQSVAFQPHRPEPGHVFFQFKISWHPATFFLGFDDPQVYSMYIMHAGSLFRLPDILFSNIRIFISIRI